MFLSWGPGSLFVNTSRLLIWNPPPYGWVLHEGIYLWQRIKRETFVTYASGAMHCSFVAAYPFHAPVKLALCDLWFTNPAERDTVHSFLMYFSPDTQTQSQQKQIKQINIYAGPPQCSQTNFAQRSILWIATYSTVLWVLHGVCCPVCRHAEYGSISLTWHLFWCLLWCHAANQR